MNYIKCSCCWYSETPSVSNHVLEHVVGLDAGRDIPVEVDELCHVHNSLPVVGVPYIHELLQKLFLCLQAEHELGVHGRVVVLLKVIDCNSLVSPRVQLVVGLLHYCLSLVVQTAVSDHVKEFVHAELALPLGVEVLKEKGCFILKYINTECSQSELEFDWVDKAIFIVIQASEFAPQGAEAQARGSISASLNDSVLEYFEISDVDFLL